MVKPSSRFAVGQPDIKTGVNGRNGKHDTLPNGRQGSVVLVCVDLGLAAEIRKLGLPAVCYYGEASQLRAFTQSRRALVAYCDRKSKVQAEQAASYLQASCNAERVGVIDLESKMGFHGPPAAFVGWYEESGGIGENFQDGSDFLKQAEMRAKWRDNHPIPFDDDDDTKSDVKDPIGSIDPKAFHGVLGQLALATQPETEANPLFVLLQLMVFFGTHVGRNPHFVISATRHYLNLFIGLIGISGWSRKGTAGEVTMATWREIDKAYVETEELDKVFVDTNVVNGLNSGAGLIKQIRDGSIKTDTKGKQTVDEGITDKRRVFLEEEYGSVMKHGHRESETLFDILRKCFDGKNVIGNYTTDPTKVTGAHVSLIGHVTPADLQALLTDLDKANGTANRFLYMFGVRSKILPRGGDVLGLLKDFLQADLAKLREAVEWASGIEKMSRDKEAEEWWEALYRRLNNVPPGRLGAFFVRGPVIIMRMACIFALTDLSKLVRVIHLEAAYAIWQHSERSLRWIFQDDADPRAEKLLSALVEKPDGLTRTQITSDVFRGNVQKEVLDALLENQLVLQTIEHVGPERGGRYRLKQW